MDSQPGRAHNKVVIAVNASEYSDHAFEWYVKYMHHAPNYLVCVHVPEFDIEKAQTQLVKDKTMKAPMEKTYSKIQELEEKYKQKLKINKIEGTVISVPSKHPGQTLIAMAREEQAIAIIMGSRGLSKLKKVIMGSCSDYVVQNSECPVVVVRLPKNEDDDSEPPGCGMTRSLSFKREGSGKKLSTASTTNHV